MQSRLVTLQHPYTTVNGTLMRGSEGVSEGSLHNKNRNERGDGG